MGVTKKVFQFTNLKQAYLFQDKCEKDIPLLFGMLSWGFIEYPTYTEVNISWTLDNDIVIAMLTEDKVTKELNRIYHSIV